MKRYLLAWAVIILLLTTYTNCDVTSNNSGFKAQSSSTCGTSCSGGQNEDLLEVKVNIPDTPSNYVYPRNVIQFDLGGACNEAGFVDNVITWKIINSNQAEIRSSQNLGLNSECHLGRFYLPIHTGAALTGQHTLVVEIFGLNKDGDIFKNMIVGRNTIYLNPQ